MTAKCMFRVWLYSSGDPDEIEVWYHGIETTDPHKRFVSEWFRESLSYEDLRDLFGVDHEKSWQIVGEATIEGRYDYYGEYDESIDIIRFEKQEIPEEHLDDAADLSRDL
jgi:hypothetical protein